MLTKRRGKGSRVYVRGSLLRVNKGTDELQTDFARFCRTFALITAPGIQHIGSILKCLQRHKFSLTNCALVELNEEHCIRLSGQENEDTSLSPGGAVALELSGASAGANLRELLGSTGDLNEGISSLYSFKDLENNSRNIEHFFGSRLEFDVPKPIASFNSTTLAIIKPHAIQKHAGDILADITDNDFLLCALKMFDLNRGQCEEFYEVYKDVVQEFPVS